MRGAWPLKVQRRLPVAGAESILPQEQPSAPHGEPLQQAQAWERAWPVVADASALEPEVVAIGGGAWGVNLHVAPADLVRELGATVADISEPA